MTETQENDDREERFVQLVKRSRQSIFWLSLHIVDLNQQIGQLETEKEELEEENRELRSRLKPLATR